MRAISLRWLNTVENKTKQYKTKATNKQTNKTNKTKTKKVKQRQKQTKKKKAKAKTETKTKTKKAKQRQKQKQNKKQKQKQNKTKQNKTKQKTKQNKKSKAKQRQKQKLNEGHKPDPDNIKKSGQREEILNPQSGRGYLHKKRDQPTLKKERDCELSKICDSSLETPRSRKGSTSSSWSESVR